MTCSQLSSTTRASSDPRSLSAASSPPGGGRRSSVAAIVDATPAASATRASSTTSAPVGVRTGAGAGHVDGQPGLAHSTRSDDRDQPGIVERQQGAGQLGRPPDRRRQRCAWPSRRPGGRRVGARRRSLEHLGLGGPQARARCRGRPRPARRPRGVPTSWRRRHVRRHRAPARGAPTTVHATGPSAHDRLRHRHGVGPATGAQVGGGDELGGIDPGQVQSLEPRRGPSPRQPARRRRHRATSPARRPGARSSSVPGRRASDGGPDRTATSPSCPMSARSASR